MRGETFGADRLPNLSTRPPSTRRNRSQKISSCRYPPISTRFSASGARVMSKVFCRTLPP